MIITPESLAGESEESQQKALFCWAALNLNKYPELKWFHHIPNGGFRAKREAVNLKAAGVKAGVLDLNLPVKRGPWGGLYIEMKRLKFKNVKRGGLSEEQKEFIEFARSQGYGVMVCYSWEEARDCLISYLEWRG